MKSSAWYKGLFLQYFLKQFFPFTCYSLISFSTPAFEILSFSFYSYLFLNLLSIVLAFLVHVIFSKFLPLIFFTQIFIPISWTPSQILHTGTVLPQVWKEKWHLSLTMLPLPSINSFFPTSEGEEIWEKRNGSPSCSEGVKREQEPMTSPNKEEIISYLRKTCQD